MKRLIVLIITIIFLCGCYNPDNTDYTRIEQDTERNWENCNYSVKSYLWVYRSCFPLKIIASKYSYNISYKNIEEEKKIHYQYLLKIKKEADELIKNK